VTSSERPRALVTGITGQDGSYLAELLLAKGYEVYGLVRHASVVNTERNAHLLEGDAPSLHLVRGDLTDSPSLLRVLESLQPHEVYNLAAQSHVHVSFELPELTGDVTGLGAARLLEGIHQLGIDARFYQASSSEMFGRVVETPQRETTPFHPRSPYAVAKVYAYHLTRNYREAYGMFAVNGILFNHESPRRGETFVTRKVTLAAARIRLGLQRTLQLGNLDAMRDWGFAGDYVDAMWRMLQAETPDDYVVATGETHSVRELCELSFAAVGLPLRWEGEGIDERGLAADGRVLVAVDPRYFRPAEVDFLLGDSSRAQAELGWRPQVTFRELVEMMVAADLARLGERLPVTGAR
jgi:GDPmannose 4,6-dehydratase